MNLLSGNLLSEIFRLRKWFTKPFARSNEFPYSNEFRRASMWEYLSVGCAIWILLVSYNVGFPF